MPTYRLYRLDGSGKIISAEWIDAESDEMSIAEAGRRVAPEGSYELWERNRLVARNSTAKR